MIERVEELKDGVTIIVLIYNHAPYIERCLRSIASQQGVSNLKVLLADDASTDGTSDLIRTFVKDDPRFVHLLRSPNLGVAKNSLEARKLLDTKYYMLVDGDDYFCDDQKVALQLEALARHPECSFCAHRTRICGKDGEELGIMGACEGEVRVFGFEDAPPTHPTARLYRHPLSIGADFYYDFLTEHEVFCWDMPLQYAFLDRAPMVFLNRVMSVYHYNGKGIFSSLSAERQRRGSCRAAYNVDLYTGFRHTDFFRRMYMPEAGWKRRSLAFRLFGREFEFRLSRRKVKVDGR